MTSGNTVAIRRFPAEEDVHLRTVDAGQALIQAFEASEAADGPKSWLWDIPAFASACVASSTLRR
jgi:hypothetical protein